MLDSDPQFFFMCITNAMEGHENMWDILIALYITYLQHSITNLDNFHICPPDLSFFKVGPCPIP